MTLMPEVHDAMRRAVRRRRRPRWLRGGFAVVGIVVVSGTAAAATGTWRPQLGSPERGKPPVASARTVPAAQAELFAVLRREQTDRDRGPRVHEALKMMSREHINGIHTDGIRVLFENRREIVLLIPVRRVGDPKFTPSVQRDVLCLWSSAYQGWGGTCADAKQLRRRGIQGGTSPDANGGLITSAEEARTTRVRVTALVPDGVARVAVRVRGGKTITADVHDNVYQYLSKGIPINLGVTWFDAGGKRIRGR
jgi:hypothetical protein